MTSRESGNFTTTKEFQFGHNIVKRENVLIELIEIHESMNQLCFLLTQGLNTDNRSNNMFTNVYDDITIEVSWGYSNGLLNNSR